MRKQLIHKAVITLLLGCIMLLAFAGCGKSNEKRNVSGSYHTEANGYKRGTDVDITLRVIRITTIVVNDNGFWSYSLTDPDAFQMMCQQSRLWFFRNFRIWDRIKLQKLK